MIDTLLNAIKTYTAQEAPRVALKDHAMTYLQQWYFRVNDALYKPQHGVEPYIYYLSTLYPNFPEYNRHRANFVRASRSVEGIVFEGGLVRRDKWRDPNYIDVTVAKYDRPSTWVQKSARSLLGFWAAGDQGAMTLKMAEYMALGKAIISLPVREEMYPAPLEHGTHIHVVDGSVASIYDAIVLLHKDASYRCHLEDNARKYYDDHLRPELAVRRYLEECRSVIQARYRAPFEG